MDTDSKRIAQSKAKKGYVRKCLFHPGLQCPNAGENCIFTDRE